MSDDMRDLALLFDSIELTRRLVVRESEAPRSSSTNVHQSFGAVMLKPGKSPSRWCLWHRDSRSGSGAPRRGQPGIYCFRSG